jgi:hypothetical protein
LALMSWADDYAPLAQVRARLLVLIPELETGCWPEALELGCYLANELGILSYAAIAREVQFVRNVIHRVASRVKRDPAFADRVRSLQARLEGALRT